MSQAAEQDPEDPEGLYVTMLLDDVALAYQSTSFRVLQALNLS